MPRIIQGIKVYAKGSILPTGKRSAGCPVLDKHGIVDDAGFRISKDGKLVITNENISKICTEECPFDECVFKEEE